MIGLAENAVRPAAQFVACKRWAAAHGSVVRGHPRTHAFDESHPEGRQAEQQPAEEPMAPNGRQPDAPEAVLADQGLHVQP